MLDLKSTSSAPLILTCTEICTSVPSGKSGEFLFVIF